MGTFQQLWHLCSGQSDAEWKATQAILAQGISAQSVVSRLLVGFFARGSKHRVQPRTQFCSTVQPSLGLFVCATLLLAIAASPPLFARLVALCKSVYLLGEPRWCCCCLLLALATARRWDGAAKAKA